MNFSHDKLTLLEWKQIGCKSVYMEIITKKLLICFRQKAFKCNIEYFQLDRNIEFIFIQCCMLLKLCVHTLLGMLNYHVANYTNTLRRQIVSEEEGESLPSAVADL